MRCVCVPRSQIAKHWRTVAQWIVQACEAGEWDQKPDDVKDRLFDSDLCLLVLLRNDASATVGCMVLEVLPEERRLHVGVVAGVRHMGDGWLSAAVEHTREVCRVLHYDRVSCGGRRGWLRRLPEHGFVFDGRLHVMGVES